MTTTIRAQQDCLLSYALSTNPNPLTVSPPGIAPGTEDEHAFADIDLVISNSGNTPVRCSKIAIVLPIGSLAQDLAVTGEGIDAYVSPESGWTIIDVQSDVLLAVPMAETAIFNAAGSSTLGSSQVRFDVVPRSGGESEVTVDGLYIHLSGIKVSDKTGIARIGIEEWASEEGEQIGDPSTRTLDVAKFPFRSGADPHPGIGRALVALTGTGQDPATKIAAGAAVVLEWHHLRGDNHELYADGQRLGGDRQEEIAGGSRWDIPNGLQRDTTFALKTVTPTPEAGFVVRWDHVTVCVTNQTLAALTVSGTLIADGAVTARTTLAVGGTLAPGAALSVTGASTTTSLTATGTVQGDYLTSTGAVHGTTVTADELGSFGSTTTGSLIATGEIEANGGATIPAEQTLSVKGRAEIFRAGTYSLFSSYVSTGFSKKFMAQSDGFISAHIRSMYSLSQSPAPEFSATFTVTIEVEGGDSVAASTTQAFHEGHSQADNSAIALVPAGKTVTIKLDDRQLVGGAGYLSLHWRPLGGNGNLEDLGPASLSPDPTDTPPEPISADPDSLG